MTIGQRGNFYYVSGEKNFITGVQNIILFNEHVIIPITHEDEIWAQAEGECSKLSSE